MFVFIYCLIFLPISVDCFVVFFFFFFSYVLFSVCILLIFSYVFFTVVSFCKFYQLVSSKFTLFGSDAVL